MAIGLMIAPAYAQDKDKEKQNEDQVIIVTGFQASLENAVAEKKNNDQIVESVSAEDIGKLPDASIGESIARLPGLTSQRTSGRANIIAIRGLGPDFSQTLLNGREQTSTGDARAVEFDQYPSEIVNQVVVYKSPNASLVGQGLVGTIDVRTIRPLEAGKQILAIGARGSYADLGKLNAGSKDFGYRVNATYVDQFADDTIGISLAAAYVDEPYQLQEFNAWGYAGAGTTASPNVIGGSKSFVTSTQLERFGINGTLQYQVTDNLMMTFDGFYSKFTDDQSKRGIELPLGFGAFGTGFNPATATVTNGFATAGTFTNVRGVIRNDIFERKADQYSFGYNAEYEGDDGWKAFLDIGYSKTDRNELSIESYAGTGFNGDDTSNGASATIGFTSNETGTVFSPSLNYSDPTRIFLTDPLGWGGGTVPQAGYYNNRIVEDELKQYRVGVEKELDGFLSAVKAGWSYTDRDKSLTPDEFLVRLAGTATQSVIPTSALLRPTNLSYLGLGPIVSYDARELIASGVLTLERNLSPDIPAKAYQIREDLMTIYVQADIEHEMTSAVLTGNFGVQAINTDQSSSGIVFASNVAQNVTLGDNYWDVLPSMNLSLRFDSDFVIRVAASRQIQRPRLDDLRAAVSYGIDTNAANNPTGANGPFINGGGGNPFLRPYRANAIDVNFEKYFGNSGIISAQFFYKDIKSYIDRARLIFDYTGYPTPTGQTPTSNIGLLETNFNTGGGSLYGAELSMTLPFNNISSSLDGFGFTGGVGYTNTKVKDAGGNVDQIPGYSKWVANGTVYFEKWGFNSRVSGRYRSSFLGDFSGFGGNLARRTALGEFIVDAQIGYDFQDGSALQGLSLYVQGQNLTDERFASIDGDGNRLKALDYQIYGRRILAGFTYKF
ncbi:TonB-dependent receptor [Sphingorhabdus lutea]|uniref:TonB-dependent receptor n=1 Tax=Sphingorhabdus lutea TaxID=1913578 RepID=A0A1L3JEK7_9SPHN|nr:TonB-dependent receptor [Sphingorhabdus lutea]APG63578.1 TonB-dependent receptor [Sphingorhabdus lutea]